jgi:polyhydroxybutyrate depolymerase
VIDSQLPTPNSQEVRYSRSIIFAIACIALFHPPLAEALCDGGPSTSGAMFVDIAGARRMFVVRLPVSYDGRTAAPVVFAFHPFGMNAQYMQSRVPVQRSWAEAIVIYPEGTARDASSPVPSWQNRPNELGNRDLLFFDAMMSWLDANACVDRTRVFAIGYSNGAQFANVLACERPGVIAGAAIAAGRLNCQPVSPKPVILSHGLRDSTAGYANAVEASRTWSTRNGCSAPPQVGVPGCSAAQSCSSAPVTLCTYAGGHEYDLPFTRIAADFFKSAAPAR